MLWLCISLPQLPLEALSSCNDANAKVVTTCEGNVRSIVCCNPAAEQANLRAGMNFSTALAIRPDLNMLERKLQAETAALQRLAAWAYQFSGAVVIGEPSREPLHALSSTLWLEIGASLKLFGGFRALLEHFERELKELHYTYRLGVAPTLEGAALLARAGIRVAITTPHALYARIRNLPIANLMLEPEIVQLLQGAGVRTIGLLLELPRDGLTRRFGAELSNFLARLTGDAPDPRPVFRLPHDYDARLEFDFEIVSTEGLLFPLRRMLREFSGFLRARDTGVQQFTLTLLHRDVVATQMRIGLSAPDRNAERFFALVREQLERVSLPTSTIEIQLRANEFAPPTGLQSDLLHGGLEQSEEFSHTIDRIAARLGDEQIHGLTTAADHRPEACWTRTSLRSSHEGRREILDFPERPLWLLPEPKPLQLSTIPQIASGPERIEGGWWDTGDVQRDYYIVRTNNGADLWIYRDLSDRGGWYLHGFWS